ncbi:MAG: carboxypeptidase-like regulatory domain-containing protein, partial [Sphingobacterium sp.]|nr:carboxypeptidase-like regulatory domain-containing protein [Sphingobacterium sp.]
MKKKQAEQYTSARWRLPSKWSYSMKIGSLALTGILISISAVAFPQRVTVKMENATLKQFLEKVQTQVEVALLYSDQLVANKRISVNTKDRDFKEVLSKELSKHHLTFKESDGQITIVPTSTYGKETVSETIQQEKLTIKGRVFNSQEPPQALENVSISIKGGATVGRTAAGGYYDVAVPKGTYLVFTLVGYRPHEVLVNRNETNLSLSLQENVSDVEEVVVVGMTEMQKKHIASSVATLDVKSNIEGKPITNLSQSLQGGVTGLNVQQGSGLPGGDAATIKIRGISTMNNSDPLVLVDGIPMDMNHIDPVTV